MKMGGCMGRWSGLVLAFLGILLGATTNLHAQGVRYDNIVLGPRGGPMASATVAVCTAGATTSTMPCSPLATIYSDEALTQPTANPFQADSLGNYGFWAAPGHYIVQIYGSGVTTKVMNVFLPCDPSNCSMSNATFSSITAGTLNLTGGLTVNGRSVATSPLASDAVMYVSPNGADSNDGLSWGTAKQTLYAAVQAMATGGGTVYVAANAACGGPVSGQGLWLYRTGSSPGTGWLQVNALNIIGVGTGTWYNNAPAPIVSLNCGSATEPALQLENINSSLRFQNLGFSGSIGANLIGGVTTVTFDNVDFGVNDTVATNGPAVFIGQASFWLYFHHCVFQANDNAGKATDGSDAAEAFVADPGATNGSASLVFITESIARNGSVKWVPGGTSNSLSVDGLTTENQTDGKGAVWIVNTNWFSGTIRNVGVADATINPTPAVEVDSGDPSATFVYGAGGYGVNAIGPMTYFSGYAPSMQNETEIPYVQGREGFYGGRVWAQFDAARRLFGPVASRFVNIAQQIPSAWPTWYGTPSTTNVTALDGTDNAGQISGGSSGSGIYFYNAQKTVNSGDVVVGGAWVRDATNPGGYGNAFALSISGCSGVTTVPLTPTINSSGYVGQGYISTGTAGEWEWWSFAAKLTDSSATSCYVQLEAQAGANQNMQFYAPTFYYIPAGTVSDSEASYIALHLASYPDSLNPPVEATLRGHPFAFGGSSDNYFATLDHTGLTANQTYTFPNESGTIGLVLAGTTGSIGGSSLAAGACVTGAVSLPGATASMAVAASPSADPGTGFTWAGWVSAAGTASVRLCNVSGASATPTAETYNVRVVQ